MKAFNVATSGAKFLVSLTEETGRFKYRFDPAKGTVAKGYNVVRHCGTIWSMMDVYRSNNHNDEILVASKDAITFLLNNYLRFYRHYELVCICEDDRIKLGGNALGILALLSIYDATNDKFLLTLANKLGDFILQEKTPDGDFIHKRYYRSGKVSAFQSMYYTGEALLALLRLYEATGDDKWVVAVAGSESVLANSDYGVAEQSHWMLYALELLYKYRPEEKYFQHALKIVRHILDFPEYRNWGRSTPTACRSEGLLAYVRMADGARNPFLYKHLRQTCMDAVEKNLSLQLKYRRPDGSFIRGGEGDRNTEVRIDYVQHNVTSFLHYHRYAEDSS